MRKIPNVLTRTLLLIVPLALNMSCSSDSTTSNTLNNSNSGAAVAAAFSSGSDSAVLLHRIPSHFLKFIIQEALAQQGEEGGGDTCGEFENSSTGSGPEHVTTFANGTAGTYGAAGNTVTVTEADFCQDEGGDQNSGNGPDENGLFAAFQVSNVTISCNDGSDDVTMSGSGIFRNLPSQNIFPQIFGQFQSGGSTFNCSISLGESEEIISASCSDDQGATIEQSSGVTCTADAGEETTS